MWITYKQVYDLVIKVGNSIRSRGVEPVKSLSSIDNKFQLKQFGFVISYALCCFAGREMWYLWCKLLRMDSKHGGTLSFLSVLLKRTICCNLSIQKNRTE